MNTYDDTQPVPDNGSVEAQPESNQTENAVVTPPQAPAPLSLQDVERLLAERDSKWSATLEAEKRQWQSKSDKAYAKALSEAQVIERNAELLGLDADTVTAAKAKMIDRQFTDAFKPDPTPETLTPAPGYMAPPSPYATADEIIPYLKEKYGLAPSDLDLTGIVGQPKSTELAQRLDELATLKAAEKIQAKRNQQAAQPIAQIARATGGLGSPQGGAPSAGLDPKAEIAQLMTQEPPDDPLAMSRYQQRLQELRAKVNGNW